MNLQSANDLMLWQGRVIIADTPWQRLRGWYGRADTTNSPAISAVLLTACRAVHSIALQRQLHLCWLDASGRCIHLTPSLKPWRLVACAAATQVLEIDVRALSARLLPQISGSQLRICHDHAGYVYASLNIGTHDIPKQTETFKYP
ncbi:MAG: DUF192 domain-containing protein [Firmicutes bacterium]|nr:DUF192 domain-containing protein [Bacillota bacterium]